METSMRLEFQPITVDELLAKYKDLDIDTPTKELPKMKDKPKEDASSEESQPADNILNLTIIEEPENSDSTSKTIKQTAIFKEIAVKDDVNDNVHPKRNDIYQSLTKPPIIRTIRSKTVDVNNYKRKEIFENPFNFMNAPTNRKPRMNLESRFATPKQPKEPIKPTSVTKPMLRKPESVLKENKENVEKRTVEPVKYQFSLLPNQNLNKRLETPRSMNRMKPVDSPIKPLRDDLMLSNEFGTITIKRKKYIVKNKLGEGGSCQVFNCLDPDTLEFRAVKIVNLAVDDVTAKGYINEVEMLRTLQKSEYVIKMFD